MERQLIEHLLKVKLTIENMQILLEGFNKKFEVHCHAKTLVGKMSDQERREQGALHLAVFHLRLAVGDIHRAVNQEEVGNG